MPPGTARCTFEITQDANGDHIDRARFGLIAVQFTAPTVAADCADSASGLEQTGVIGILGSGTNPAARTR